MAKSSLQMARVIFEISPGDRKLLRIIARERESTQVDLLRSWIREAARKLIKSGEKTEGTRRSIEEIRHQEHELRLKKVMLILGMKNNKDV